MNKESIAGFTAGPWNIGEPGGPAGPFYSIVSQQGRVVAMQIPRQADARLIAAAPALLAAAQRVLAWYPPDLIHESQMERDVGWQDLRALLQAVQQATGAPT